MVVKKCCRKPGFGRPPVDIERTLDASLLILKTGAPWRSVPEDLYPSLSSCHRYIQAWAHEALLAGESPAHKKKIGGGALMYQPHCMKPMLHAVVSLHALPLPHPPSPSGLPAAAQPAAVHPVGGLSIVVRTSISNCSENCGNRKRAGGKRKENWDDMIGRCLYEQKCN